MKLFTFATCFTFFSLVSLQAAFADQRIELYRLNTAAYIKDQGLFRAQCSTAAKEIERKVRYLLGSGSQNSVSHIDGKIERTATVAKAGHGYRNVFGCVLYVVGAVPELGWNHQQMDHLGSENAAQVCENQKNQSSLDPQILFVKTVVSGTLFNGSYCKISRLHLN